MSVISTSRRRAAPLCFLLVAGALTHASCRDIVAGDPTNVMDQLCETLSACYGEDDDVPDCDAVLRARFDQGTQEEVSAFLGFIQSRECFDTCPHVLGCTDEAPLCVQSGACVGRSDCCDWSGGVTDCEGGACCKRDGQPCGDSAECCEADCRGGYCGGRQCAAVGEPCGSSFECCTERCVQGVCASLSECAGLDETCTSDEDCCADTSVVEGGDARALVCDLAAGKCRPPTEACGDGNPCDPTEEVPCCATGLRCWETEVGGVCGPESCQPVDVDCESDADCCANGVCDYAPQPHCVVKNPDLACGKTGASCGDPSDCCSLSCGASGHCLELASAPCGVDLACHDPCSVGPPMQATSCLEDPTFGGKDACIGAVVTADPFCGCVEWDDVCVGAAVAQCGCQ